MITVYGNPPTRSTRVIWMLEELGLEYRIHPVDFMKRMEDSEFIAASPTGSFPGLEDGDVRLMESCAILEYLGNKYGPTPLVPTVADPSYPGYISYLHFGEASLSAPLNVMIASKFFAPEDQKDNWGSRVAVDMFVRKAGALARPLRESDYVAGDVFTAADIACGYSLLLARNFGFEDRLDPLLPKYLDRLTARPAFGRAMAHAKR